MLCSSCGLEIPEGRLRLDPNAKLCTKCQEEIEQAVERPAPSPPASEPYIDRDVLAETIVEAQKRLGNERDLGDVRQRLDNDQDFLKGAFEASDVSPLYHRNKKRRDAMAKAITDVGRERGEAVNLEEIKRRLHNDPELRDKARRNIDVMKLYNRHMGIKPTTSDDLF